MSRVRSALKHQAAQGVLKVSTAHNATSIYGSSGILTFRIFHDYGHLLYDAEFTTQQEVNLAKTQWDDLQCYMPHDWRKVCAVVYFADTVEQSLFESITGDFPTNQKESVMDHLASHFNAQ